jgi:hypothetical protein
MDSAVIDGAVADAAVEIDAAIADAAPTDDAALDAGVEPDAMAEPDAMIEPDLALPSVPPELQGVWAHRQTLVGIAEVPVIGAVESPTVTTMRVTFSATPEGLVMNETICGLLLGDQNGIVRLIVPNAFRDSIGLLERPASLDGAAFSAARFLELRGAELADPDNDALPTEPDDPRLTDPDEDGNPGLTVRATGLVDGEIYVVQRSWTILDGQLEGDRLDGLIEWNSEQIILDADNPVLLSGAPSGQVNDANRHWFRSTRIDEGRDCDWIVENADRLFER